MKKFPHDTAINTAYKALDVINAYKRAVNLPETPIVQGERFDGIVQGVLNVWEHPHITPEENHNNWVEQMMENGWTYGELNEELKTHPALVNYEDIPFEYKVNDILFMAIVLANTPEMIEVPDLFMGAGGLQLNGVTAVDESPFPSAGGFTHVHRDDGTVEVIPNG